MDDDQKVIPEPVEVKITTPPEEVDEQRTVERTETTESTETVTEPADSDD